MCREMQLVVSSVTEGKAALANDGTTDCISVLLWGVSVSCVMLTFVFIGGGAGVCLLCFVRLLRGLQAC